MFNYKHYIPILRWKAAEKGALLKLKKDDKSFVTPLVEFTMPQPKSDGDKTPKDLLNESIEKFSESLSSIADQVMKYWGDNAIFIDIQLIDASIRSEVLKKILEHGQQLNIFMIPVITIIPVVGFESDIQTRQVAIEFSKKSGYGLCLRITDSNFKEKSLSSDIENFLRNNKLKAEDVDMLVDFKIVNEKTFVDSLEAKINIIPQIAKWRTFIVAGGSFPQDLSHLEKHNQHNIPRLDWAIWRELLNKLKRQPSFADYTIQYPIYLPKTSVFNPSASIRYTLEKEWVIVRGEGLRNLKGAGFKQYPAQAQILANQKKVFKGEDFSAGDAYIAEKAKDIKTEKTGNPKTWLEAGINHHMSLVVDQISSLREK